MERKQFFCIYTIHKKTQSATKHQVPAAQATKMIYVYDEMKDEERVVFLRCNACILFNVIALFPKVLTFFFQISLCERNI